jgi:putative glycosyltransferase (TIGR04372 family)
MGRYVEKEVSVDNPRIIDYAAKGGVDIDFLDVYLSAHCRFFIAGPDGLADMPKIFRRPVVWVDFIPLRFVSVTLRNHLVIPKKLWRPKENRFVSFGEMFDTEVAEYCKTEDYEKAGLEIIDNSAEEIMDVSMEMDERLNGTWVETEEDKALQQRFRSIVQRSTGVKCFGSIGANFLRQHRHLLELPSKEESITASS